MAWTRGQQAAASLAVFVALAVVWTWPLVLSPGDTLVSGFDTWGVVWTVHAADTLGLDMTTTSSSFPYGQKLLRSDSVLLLLAMKAVPFRLPPVGVVSFLALIGPAVSAWAAERCAVALGAKFPWSLVAGVSFGFLGPAAAAFSGGQVYVLLDPWLPLLGWAWVRAGHADGKPLHGVLAGVAWSLCLLTTVYVGIVATLLVLLGMWPLRRRWRSMLPAAAVALPVGLAYAWIFSQGEMRGDAITTDPRLVLEMGSASLAGLAAWSPTATPVFHDVSPLGWTIVALVAFSPFLPGRHGSRWWLGVGLVGLALALGPTLRVDSLTQSTAPWVLWPVATDELARWFHFPIRMLWLTALAFGIVAARALTGLGEDRPRLAAVIVVACLVESPLLTLRLWGQPVPAALPSAYAATPEDRPLLDLFPAAHGEPIDYPLYQTDLTCAWAALHRRPIANTCLDTVLGVDPRSRISERVHHDLLTGVEATVTRDLLADLGFGSVVVRVDHYLPSDRARIVAGLDAALGEPLAESTDGGEHLVVWGVPTSSADPVATYEALGL